MPPPYSMSRLHGPRGHHSEDAERAVTEASPMVKAKDERRERRDDFANETADDAEAGDSEE